MKKNFIALVCLLVFAFTLSKAQPSNISLTSFSTGFNDPVDLTHAGDDRIFVVEQDGRIYIVDQNGVRINTPFLDIDARVNSGANERGLLGLAFHPDYQENGFFYLNYTRSNGATRISRFSVDPNDPNLGDANSEVTLLEISQPYSNHNGGGIKFGHDGYLYIGMGDGGSGGDPQNYGQNTNSLLGKMLRIDVDGPNAYDVPADNPFVNDANVMDEIWSIGLRNPWRFSFDRVTGDMWIGDVGQNAREEIDFESGTSAGGDNYGWRCYEGFNSYNTSGCQASSAYTDPVFHYNNNFSTGCSVTGGFVYRGARYGNLWGIYFFTDYCSGRLWYTTGDQVNGWTTMEHNQYSGNYSSFGEDIYGQIYVVDHNGTVFRMEDNTCDPKAYIDAPASYTVCGTEVELEAFQSPGLTYQWSMNGTPINGATNPTYTTTTPGNYTVEVTNGNCSDVSDAVAVSFSTPPTVTLSGLASNYNQNDPTVTMTGSPAGGTYSGPGVSGNGFDPAAAGPGVHSIVYSYTDGQGCTGTDTVSVTVGTVNISASDLLDGFYLAPNPGRDLFRMGFNLEFASSVSYTLIDVNGRQLHHQDMELESGVQEIALNFSDVATGIYLLKLTIGEEEYAERLVIE